MLMYATLQDVYKHAGNTGVLQTLATLEGIKMHGRRVNDEVELFEWDGGKVSSGRVCVVCCGM